MATSYGRAAPIELVPAPVFAVVVVCWRDPAGGPLSNVVTGTMSVVVSMGAGLAWSAGDMPSVPAAKNSTRPS